MSHDQSGRRFYRNRLLVGAAVLALLLVLAGCVDNPQPPGPKNTNSAVKPNANGPAPGLNQSRRDTAAPAPPGPMGWSLLDNRRMRLADQAGKVVLLDFWATYCPPCVAEAPHLAALQRKYAKDGLVVVGLNVGGPDDRPKIADFIQQTGVQYDLGFPDNALVDSLTGGDDSIPQTFIFDRKGTLVNSFVGFTPETGAEIEAAIQASLGAKP